MDAAGWNQRYDTTELVWTAEPNRFLVAEISSLDALVRARRPGQR